MDLLYERGAGLDVHQDEVIACVCVVTGPATRREQKRETKALLGSRPE